MVREVSFVNSRGRGLVQECRGKEGEEDMSQVGSKWKGESGNHAAGRQEAACLY